MSLLEEDDDNLFDNDMISIDNYSYHTIHTITSVTSGKTTNTKSSTTSTIKYPLVTKSPSAHLSALFPSREGSIADVKETCIYDTVSLISFDSIVGYKGH